MKRMACLLAAILAASCGHRPPDLPRVNANIGATHRVDTKPGHGSGVVVNEDGYVLTCLHVVAEAKSVTVIVSEDGKADVAYPAEIRNPDESLDLVTLKIGRRFPRAVVLEDPDSVHPGDPVYAIGYPFDLGRTVWRGSIARMHADNLFRGYRNSLMLDIKTGHGMSGAGVYSAASGKLVGLMRGELWRERADSPPTTMSSAIAVEDMIRYLDRTGVRYRLHWPDDGRAAMEAVPSIRVTVVVAPR